MKERLPDPSSIYLAVSNGMEPALLCHTFDYAKSLLNWMPGTQRHVYRLRVSEDGELTWTLLYSAEDNEQTR